MEPRTPRLAGAILCGGASRRMGFDKVRLDVAGTTLLQRAITRLGSVADPLVLATGVEAVAHGSVAAVADAVPDSGPLGGLVAALRVSPHRLCAVVAVDMPDQSPRLFQLLAACWRGEDAVVPVDGRGPQPLHAVYATTVLPAAATALAGPDRSLRTLLRTVNTRLVDVATLEATVPPGFATNLNTPDEVTAWAAAAAGQPPPRPR